MNKGSQGYQNHTSTFITTSQSLSFQTVCKDFLPYLPAPQSNILDLGSGAGQNAAALDQLGYQVTAIEPLQEFMQAAKSTYNKTSVDWIIDNLPQLKSLDTRREHFDFVLIEGVWHHLDEQERIQAAARISRITKTGGRCAISLRNGPAGFGTLVYPTDTQQTIDLFNSYGFECIFKTENQDSILPNKEQVKWARIVLQKQNL